MLAPRCHPDLAAVPNEAFYGGRLQDACTADQRGPLVPGLPPLVFCDVRGREETGAGTRSASNRSEATAVVQVLVAHAYAGGGFVWRGVDIDCCKFALAARHTGGMQRGTC